MSDETRKFVFGSKYPGYMLVLETGGPKYINNQFIPKVPFRGVTFNSGVFDTEDEEIATEMKKHKMHGKDFWEITKPEDARRVNPGKQMEVSEGVKGTSQYGRK